MEFLTFSSHLWLRPFLLSHLHTLTLSVYTRAGPLGGWKRGNPNVKASRESRPTARPLSICLARTTDNRLKTTFCHPDSRMFQKRPASGPQGTGEFVATDIFCCSLLLLLLLLPPLLLRFFFFRLTELRENDI